MNWKVGALGIAAIAGVAGTVVLAALYATKDEALPQSTLDATLTAAVATGQAETGDTATAEAIAARNTAAAGAKATATAAYQNGRADAERCDTVVGAPEVVVDETTVGISQAVRSTKTGNVYTVRTRTWVVSLARECSGDTESDACQAFDEQWRDAQHDIGSPWPPGCQ